MFGLLLRSELLQGSAVRTWNCVLNIANFFRYKFNNFRQPVMPRTRRRHHSRSRSRSRSHSHDRDREPKRRRVESPENTHQRRSVSAEKEVIPNEDAAIQISSDEEQPRDITSQEYSPKEDSPKSKKEDESDDDKEEQSKEEKEDESNENHEKKSDDKDKLKDMIFKQVTPKKITPKKVMSPMQIKKHEERLKLKLEKEEQRRKEREEKEERRRKEREEKEEQKRKEREEKEEQKRKENEQKRKEREEKEEQKRKEKEEKDEQKRKEKEERELKKLQELDEKNKEKKKKEEQFQKEKVAFASFFRKSAGGSELKKSECETKQTLAFMPFQVKSDMRLAPVIRTNLSSHQKQTLVDNITDQLETVLYLDELKKGKQLGLSDSTWPVFDDTDDVQILEDSDIGEKVEEQPKAKKMRAKLLKFHENRRPAYFGTWRKRSQQITPRKPLAVDKEFFDYEVDSDDDWEEEEPGESLHGSDDEEKENDEKDDYEVDNEFFVPHGYLSDEEVEAEENCEVSAETQKEKLKILQEEFDEEMKSKTQKIKPRLIGCIWENNLIPKVQDAIHKFLEDRMMIVTGTIQIQKRDVLNTTIEVSGSKQFRKPLAKELIPEFLQLIHGNTKNQVFLVNEFHKYLSSRNLNKVSRASLLSHLKQFAKWKKCPDEGEMLNKHCWYVDEDIRSQYEVNLKLPNNWTYIGDGNEESVAKKALAV